MEGEVAEDHSRAMGRREARNGEKRGSQREEEEEELFLKRCALSQASNTHGQGLCPQSGG